jgi:hypothetical protein
MPAFYFGGSKAELGVIPPCRGGLKAILEKTGDRPYAVSLGNACFVCNDLGRCDRRIGCD